MFGKPETTEGEEEEHHSVDLEAEHNATPAAPAALLGRAHHGGRLGASRR